MFYNAKRCIAVFLLSLMPAVATLCHAAEAKKAAEAKPVEAKAAPAEKAKAEAPPKAEAAKEAPSKEAPPKAAKKGDSTAGIERTPPIDRPQPAERKSVEASAPPAPPARPPVATRPPPPRVVVALANVRKEPAAPAAVHADGHTPHWSYEGKNGPHAWAKLSPEFAACGSGTRQSPIDLRDGMKVDLDPIVFDYRPSGFKVIDNGHTIQANVGGWNSMRIAGRRFRLVQFHFHSPSEEMIDGKQFDMVAHLVHKDGEGRLAVVAVLIERGTRQPAIQTVLNNLPLERGEEQTASSPIDVAQLLPADRRYFTYMGSLTTPPCTEDVLWVVMKQPVQATAEQLNLFSRMYPMNARPVQDAGDRIVKESN